jgi:hypothetical protein
MKLWQIIFSFLTNIMPTCEYQKAGITQSVLFGYGLDN